MLVTSLTLLSLPVYLSLPFFFFLMLPPPPRSTLFPYTTLFRSLSFLGLGQQPPNPSWGSMLNTARSFMAQAPWMSVWPGLAIFSLVLSLNLFGDGLRDALDPRRE